MVIYTWPTLNFLSTGSHANCPGISLSVSSYKGILYLERLGGVQLKEPPCTSASYLPILDQYEHLLSQTKWSCTFWLTNNNRGKQVPSLETQFICLFQNCVGAKPSGICSPFTNFPPAWCTLLPKSPENCTQKTEAVSFFLMRWGRGGVWRGMIMITDSSNVFFVGLP